MFLDRCIDGARMYQRTARVLHKSGRETVVPPRSQFHDLTVAARHRISVTLCAGLSVVNWAKPVCDLLLFFKTVFVFSERGWVSETVGVIVKPSRRFRRRLALNCVCEADPNDD